MQELRFQSRHGWQGTESLDLQRQTLVGSRQRRLKRPNVMAAVAEVIAGLEALLQRFIAPVQRGRIEVDRQNVDLGHRVRQPGRC